MLPDTFIIGSDMIKLDAIGSTNDFARDLLTKQEELVDGTVVIAENQQEGKGQRGNNWVSEPGKNLTFSVILYPKFIRPSDQFDLSKAMSLGILSYLREVLPVNLSAIKIKWPNDIYIGSDKICGILIENLVSGAKLTHSIVGIGLNVNQKSFDKALPNPTSMNIVAKKEFNLEHALSKLCIHLDRRYLQLRNEGVKKIGEEYMQGIYKFRELSEFEINGASVSGKIIGISTSGKLILDVGGGKEVQCDFKEIVYR